MAYKLTRHERFILLESKLTTKYNRHHRPRMSDVGAGEGRGGSLVAIVLTSLGSVIQLLIVAALGYIACRLGIFSKPVIKVT